MICLLRVGYVERLQVHVAAVGLLSYFAYNDTSMITNSESGFPLQAHLPTILNCSCPFYKSFEAAKAIDGLYFDLPLAIKPGTCVPFI